MCQSRASPTLVRAVPTKPRPLVGTRSLSSGRPNGSGLWPARWQAPAGPVGFAHPTDRFHGIDLPVADFGAPIRGATKKYAVISQIPTAALRGRAPWARQVKAQIPTRGGTFGPAHLASQIRGAIRRHLT